MQHTALASALAYFVLVPASAGEGAPFPWTATPSTSVIAEDMVFHSRGASLSGTLHLPRAEKPVGAVVIAHSATTPLRDASLYKHLSDALPSLGIAVLLFDRRGSGSSGGDLESSDYQRLADDVIQGVNLLKADRRIDPERIGVWGLSQGGWIALLAAARSADVSFVVSISAPLVTPDVQMMFRSQNSLRIEGFAEKDIAQMRAARQAVDDYMRGTISREKAQRQIDEAKVKPWFDLLYMGSKVGDRATSRWRKEIEYDPLPALDRVKVPALLLFGANDPEVPVMTSVERILQRARKNVGLYVVRGADHHMATSLSPRDMMNPAQTSTVRAESAEYFAVLSSWLTRQGISTRTE